MENMLIRRIRLEDADELSQIQTAITKSSPTIDFRQIIKHQVRKDEDASFVAEIDGKVVGYMISYIVYGGFGLEKSAWIATLGVNPKYMDEGIGKRLAEEILDVYRERGITHIFTSVRWDSADILSFFKTLGFDRSDFMNLKKELNS
ncbi:MAG: GNAT family N-acetyltransferase [Desulfobacteraceae bacterium]|nr:GNAT family N-acetyltransferase [Desulfobacteraceae bacterium]